VGPVADSNADPRPAKILRRIGAGGSVEQAADDAGINRKTIVRWRNTLHDFGEAYARVLYLASLGTEDARGKVDAIVRSWTPGGLVTEAEREAFAGPELEPEGGDGDPDIDLETDADFEPEPVPGVEVAMTEVEQPAVTDPDVLSADGRELVVQPPVGSSKPRRPKSPYTTTRPPTLAEWTATMAALAVDKDQPERIRLGAIASVTATLAGGPGARLNRPVDDVGVAEAAAERGREPGVPASVWQEARHKFLGPAPEPEPDTTRSGDVVEFERAPPG
jgi:hypothetical protein